MAYNTAAQEVAEHSISWLAAQRRPFIAANLAALAFILVSAVAAMVEGLSTIPLLRFIWPGLLFYLAFVLSFLLPTWLVQLVIYSQMWQQGRPHFIDVQSAERLDRKRQCRFVLALRTQVFVLCVLYVDTRARSRYWIRPAWLYLALFASGLLAFCLFAISIPVMPSLLVLSAITFWSSSLVFGMGHLLVGAG